MNDEVDYERHLSVMNNRFCRSLDSGALTNDEIKLNINLCCIGFSFAKAWILQRAQYCLTNLDFEIRALRTHRDLGARVLVD